MGYAAQAVLDRKNSIVAAMVAASTEDRCESEIRYVVAPLTGAR